MELNIESKLSNARRKLTNIIDFPFVFLDEENNEISPKDELSNTLNDILDGKKLYVKRKIKQRKILGDKIDTINNLDLYLYPNINIEDLEEKNFFNIMVIGETGVGKLTWIHCLLNYLEEIDIEEKIRYLLFNEKQKQEKYEKIYGKKSLGSSITDIPEIYLIPANKLVNKPIQVIDTTGFDDTRGIEYDNKIIKDIYDLLMNNKIYYINAICLILKSTESRAHERMKYLMDESFSLFSEDVKANFLIIFTFVDNFNNFQIIKVLKNENMDFSKIFGNIKNLPIFSFNNKAYFDDDINFYNSIFQNNAKNFEDLFDYISCLEPSSLDKTKKILKERIEIREEIKEIISKIK